MSESSSSGFSPEASLAAAVIVAGGAGRRMGGVRKQYLELLGEPVLLRALRPFVEHPGIGATVVVLPPGDVGEPPSWLAAAGVAVVAGGAERGDSVWNGLMAVPAAAGVVLVHDGARPLVTREIIDRVLRQAVRGGAVAAVPATDTLKEVGIDGQVTSTLDRSRIWHAQTPQGFPRRMLVEAYARARAEGWPGTDDASIVERYGGTVAVVMGSPENLKITRPEDLPVAEAIARRRAPGGEMVQGQEG